MPDWIDTLDIAMDRLNTKISPCPCCHCQNGITRVAPCKVVVPEYAPIDVKGALLYYCETCEHETVEVGID